MVSVKLKAWHIVIVLLFCYFAIGIFFSPGLSYYISLGHSLTHSLIHQGMTHLLMPHAHVLHAIPTLSSQNKAKILTLFWGWATSST